MARKKKKSFMNATATMSLPMAAFSSMGQASLSAVRNAAALYARTPLASTGWLILSVGGMMAVSNALFGQHHVHPSPFFYQPRSEMAQMQPEVVQPAPAPQNRVAVQAPAAQPLPAVTQISPQPIVAAPAQVSSTERVTNEMLASAQRKLQDMGLFSGQVDGLYGPKTAEAIRAFELRAGLPAKGALDARVIDLIIGTTISNPVRQTAPVINPPVMQQPVAANDQVPSGQAALQTLISTASATPQTTEPNVAADPEPTASIAEQTSAAPAVTSVPQTSAGPIDVTDREYVRKVQKGLASLAFLHGTIDGIAGESTARAIRNFEVFYNYEVTGRVTPELLDLLIEQGATIN